MTASEFFRNMEWGSTLQVAIIRIGVASLIWALVMLIVGEIGVIELPIMVVSLIFGFFFFLVLAIVASGLTHAGVPYIGLLALPAYLIAVGDPVVRGLWMKWPKVVPVQNFKWFNPPFLGVFKPDE